MNLLYFMSISDSDVFTGMKAAGRLAAELLDSLDTYIEPGISTLAINDLCHKMILSAGAIPAPLNYRGFPKSICTSVNDVVCHGIPDGYELRDGDIINIDVTVILNGWHGDTSRTYLVGDKFKNPDVETKKIIKLVNAAHDSMMIGISKIKPGIRLSEIGRAIQNYIKPMNFGIVRDYCGHGIGREFHTYPSVLHYYEPSYDCIIKKGMCFTVEPMINMGHHDTILSQDDRWTVRTKDGSLSAQFEHTIGVTDDGYEIFTLSNTVP